MEAMNSHRRNYDRGQKVHSFHDTADISKPIENAVCLPSPVEPILTDTEISAYVFELAEWVVSRWKLNPRAWLRITQLIFPELLDCSLSPLKIAGLVLDIVQSVATIEPGWL